MKIYSGMTYYWPSYEEGEGTGRQRDLGGRKKRKKAAKKARRGQR